MRRAWVLVSALLVFGCAGPDAADTPLDPAAVRAGREIYLNNGCANCHGDDGSGSGAFGAAFDQPPRDYRDPNAYRLGTDIESIAETVADGLPAPGGGMPAFRHLSEESRRQLAAYIVSLQHPDSTVVSVEEGWIGEVIPGLDSTGAWMTLINSGSDDAVVAVEVDGARDTMVHQTTEMDGMMRMERLDRLALPGGARVELEPGGLHLMLERLDARFAHGDTVNVTLFLESRTAVRFVAPVRRRDGAR